MQTSKIILVDKKIHLNLLSKKLILPKRIQDKIDGYWEDLLKNGKKYTRGRVFSAIDIKEEKKEIRIDFVLTDYAHYLYSSNVGLPKKYACKNVHTSCLIETTDNVLIFGRMGKNTSRAGIIQCIGGGLDEEDIFGKKIDLKHNMEKELFEEVGIDDLIITKYLGSVPGAKEGDIVFVFRAETSQEPKLMEPEKFSEWKWCKISEIPSNFINPEALKLI